MSENVFCLLLSCESQMFVLLPFSQMPPRATGIRSWDGAGGVAVVQPSQVYTL